MTKWNTAVLTATLNDCPGVVETAQKNAFVRRWLEKAATCPKIFSASALETFLLLISSLNSA